MVHGLWVSTHMSSLVTLTAPTCTWKLGPGMCGNGSTVTMNNEEGQSLALTWLAGSGPTTTCIAQFVIEANCQSSFHVCPCCE